MEINKLTFFGLSYFRLLFLFHIFLVTLIFLYIGFARKNIVNWFYYFVAILAIIIIIYHIYRLFTHGLKEKFWNYMHLLLIAPLLLYLFYKKANTPEYIYDIFIGLGAASFAINLYFIFSH